MQEGLTDMGSVRPSCFWADRERLPMNDPPYLPRNRKKYRKRIAMSEKIQYYSIIAEVCI